MSAQGFAVHLPVGQRDEIDWEGLVDRHRGATHRQGLPIGRQGSGAQHAGCTRTNRRMQHGQRLAGRHIPDADRLVLAHRDEPLPIPREEYLADDGRVPCCVENQGRLVRCIHGK